MDSHSNQDEKKHLFDLKSPTPPKFNLEPQNDGFQKESPFPGTSLQVPCQISGVKTSLKLKTVWLTYSNVKRRKPRLLHGGFPEPTPPSWNLKISPWKKWRLFFGNHYFQIPVNWHMDPLKMYLLLKMVIFQPAMLLRDPRLRSSHLRPELEPATPMPERPDSASQAFAMRRVWHVLSLLGDIMGVSMQIFLEVSPLSSAKAPLYLRQSSTLKNLPGDVSEDESVAWCSKVYGRQQAMLSGHDMSI